MKTKVCTKCGLEKPIDEFVKRSSSSDGHASWCKQCQHNHYLQYYKEAKQKFRLRAKQHIQKIKDYIVEKKSCGCAICGEKDIACLDFHHINGKDFTISQSIRNVAFDKIKEEVDKCIVLCSNCHRKLHYYNLQLSSLGSNPSGGTTEN